MLIIVNENYKNNGGLTVGELKKILENYPDEMKITVRTLTEHFPANTVKEGEYNLYPLGCDGIPQGKEKCLRIE